MQYEWEQRQIRETRKMISAARKGKGKCKKKVQHMPTGLIEERNKRSKDTEMFGTTFGIQMIADRFEDGWHKYITDIFGGQRIKALFGNGVT